MDKKEIIQEFLDYLNQNCMIIAKVQGSDHFNEGSTLVTQNSYKVLQHYLVDKD